MAPAAPPPSDSLSSSPVAPTGAAVPQESQVAELDQTRLEALAEALGRAAQPGDTLLLRGEMGAGKTTFTRAFARGLGVRRPDRVTSPTFNICQLHEGPLALMHLDLFRMTELAEDGVVGEAAFESLGLSELSVNLSSHGSGPASAGVAMVVVVEWPDAWTDAPASALSLTLVGADRDTRDLCVGADHPRAQAWWAATSAGM